MLAGGATACGPPPPQVPASLANTVSTSVSDLSEACGQAYQAFAPGGAAADLTPLEQQATTAGLDLARIEQRNPAWIYQGDTLQQVVALSVRRLLECRLNVAAARIERETQ